MKSVFVPGLSRLLGVIAIVLTAAACGGSASTGTPASTETFKLLVVQSLSGALATGLGIPLQNGVKASIDVVTKQGGVNGHKIEVKWIDDGSSPTTGVSVLQQELASGAKYNMIILHGSSSIVVPQMAAVASQVTDTLVMSTAGDSQSLNKPATYPTYFGDVLDFTTAANGIGPKLAADHIGKVAVIVPNNLSGQQSGNAIVASAKANGVTATQVLVPPATVDARPQLQQAMDGKPDALAFATATSGVAAALLKARTQLGITIPFYFDQAAAAVDFATIVSPADLKGVIVETLPHLVASNPASQSARMKTYQAAMKAYDPHPTTSAILQGSGYNQLMAASAAAKKANSIDGVKMAKALETITKSSDIPNWLGDFDMYSPTNHYPSASAKNWVFVAAGPRVDGLITSGG